MLARRKIVHVIRLAMRRRKEKYLIARRITFRLYNFAK